MRNILCLCQLILLLNFIIITKEDICPDNQISISSLGKCINITDILLDRNLIIKTENLFFLATNKEGKIQKNGFKLDIYKLNDTKLQSHNMRKSKLYIPNSCFEKMEDDIQLQLDKNKGIIIIVQNYNENNSNNISDNYFIIRHNSPNTKINYINSNDYDFSYCNNDPILFDEEIHINTLRYNYNDTTPIDIQQIMYGKKYGIDLFNPNSEFFNDICFKFTSEKGFDVPLESRVEDYYQNITFCDDRKNSHYISCNYSSIKSTFTFRCAFGYYKNEGDKSSYLDTIDSELKSLVSVSNLKVIKCYKQFLNLRDIIRNYGGMICIVVLIIHIICFLMFCFTGIKPLENKLEDLIILGKAITRRLSNWAGFHGIGDLSGEDNSNNQINIEHKKKFNLWGQIKLLRLKRQKIKESIKLKVSNPPKKGDVLALKENAKESERININIVDIKESDFDIFQNKQKPIKLNPSRQKSVDKNIQKTGGSKILKTKDKKTKKEKENKEKKSENSQIYDYDDDELNELPLDKALKKDHRNFCQYYWNILLDSHIILNIFLVHDDYNLFTIKLCLLLMTFAINLTFNIFFFTSESMELTYVKSVNDISRLWDDFVQGIYSSILSAIALVILKYLSLTHNSIRALRKIKDMKIAEKKSVCIIRCIKIRIVIYYILSFIFNIVFGFYILSFCAIFENTQTELIISMFYSWLISLIYPFIICFIASILRSIAFRCKSKFIYIANKIFLLLN